MIKRKRIISAILAVLLLSSLCTAFAAEDEHESRAVIGADLTDDQVAALPQRGYRLANDRAADPELLTQRVLRGQLLARRVLARLETGKQLLRHRCREVASFRGQDATVPFVAHCSDLRCALPHPYDIT